MLHQKPSVADDGPPVQQRRISEIFDRLDHANETYNAAENPNMDTGAYEFSVSVRTLAATIEPLAKRHVYDTEEPDPDLVDYWHNWGLGSVELYPPDILHQVVQDKSTRVLGNPDLSPRQYIIEGIGETGEDKRDESWPQRVSFLKCPRRFEEYWQVVVRPKHHGQRPIKRGIEKFIPIEISFSAFRCCRNFLECLGIELEHRDDSTDIIRNFDQSGEESTAEFGTGEYSGNPDL